MDDAAEPTPALRKKKPHAGLAAPAEEPAEAAGKPKKKKPRLQKSTPAEPAPKKAKAAAEDRPDVALLPAAEQAAVLWDSYRSECGGGSFLEHAEFEPPSILLLPRRGESLQARLQAALPTTWRDTLGRAPPHATRCGAPALLVVAPAALRALELLRELPDFHRACPVAKLFAKHIKIAEQVELLASRPLCIGVGTPARLAALVADGALSLERVALVVVDCSRDVKLRNLLDIPETRRDFWALLWRQHLGARVAAGHTRIALL